MVEGAFKSMLGIKSKEKDKGGFKSFFGGDDKKDDDRDKGGLFSFGNDKKKDDDDDDDGKGSFFSKFLDGGDDDKRPKRSGFDGLFTEQGGPGGGAGGGAGGFSGGSAYAGPGPDDAGPGPRGGTGLSDGGECGHGHWALKQRGLIVRMCDSLERRVREPPYQLPYQKKEPKSEMYQGG